MSTYPYAPLKPTQAARRLRNAVLSYGVGLGIDSRDSIKSEQTTRDGNLADHLEERVQADMQQLEFGPLEAVQA